MIQRSITTNSDRETARVSSKSWFDKLREIKSNVSNGIRYYTFGWVTRVECYYLLRGWVKEKENA